MNRWEIGADHEGVGVAPLVGAHGGVHGGAHDVVLEVCDGQSNLSARIAQRSQSLGPSRSAADNSDHSRWRSDLEKVGCRAERGDT